MAKLNERHLLFDETKYKRIIAISDIHGGIDLFDQLLAEVALTDDDLLVLVGDYINRGNHSLAVLHRVMALAKLPNCIVLSGNHEPFVLYLLKNEKRHANLVDFVNRWNYPTLIHEMIAELKAKGVKLSDDSVTLSEQMIEAYRTELQFMEDMAILLEGKQHIFVHASYQPHYQLPQDYDKYVKFDNYIELTEPQAKTIVVGHWPISNFIADKRCNIPHFCRNKNVILIDGGLNIKSSGELNAFIIKPQQDDYHYDYRQVNDFETVRVIASFDYPQEDIFDVSYPDYAVDLIEKGDLLSRFRHCKSGAELSAFNCLVEPIDDHYQLKIDYLNAFLNVPINTEVELAKKFSDCSIVKYGDAFYWCANQQLDFN